MFYIHMLRYKRIESCTNKAHWLLSFAFNLLSLYGGVASFSVGEKRSEELSWEREM